MLSPVSTSYESTGEGHLAFLRATQDDRFRAALEADPQAALAEYGLSVDPDEIPSNVTLPNAESILDTLIDIDDESADRMRKPWFGFFGD